MKILILGYSGYVGMGVYNVLKKNNYIVTGISRKNSFKIKNYKNFNFLKKKIKKVMMLKQSSRIQDHVPQMFAKLVTYRYT